MKARNRKLKDSQVRALIQDRIDGLKYDELVRKYNISKTAVSDLLNGKSYKEITAND